MKKIDLRRELEHLYRPPTKQVVEIEVPEMSFLMVDGEGDAGPPPKGSRPSSAIHSKGLGSRG